MQKEILCPKVGVAAVVIREGQILLGKRKGSHGRGDWSIPGGHLEFGEDIEACAKRELFEETGMIALSTYLGPWTSTVFPPNKHYISLFVYINEFAGEPQLTEPDKCFGWQWFPVDDLPQPLFAPLLSFTKIVDLKALSQPFQVKI